MSETLSLVQYHRLADGGLSEDGAVVIESAHVPSELLARIEQTCPRTTQLVFEGADEGSSSIDCFSDDTVARLRKFLEEEFVRLLDYPSHQGLRQLVARELVEEAMDAFRSVTNLHHLVRLKAEKFVDSSHAVLKLG